MIRLLTAVSFLALLTGCGDGQPFFDEGEVDPDAPVDPDDPDDGSLDPGVELPPGTAEPSPDTAILRYEARNEQGGGLVTDVSYDPVNDTFQVDNLGFDGENVYQRGTAVGTLNGYAVYEADIQTPDFLTGNPVGQVIPYSALLGVSTNAEGGEARSSFAIVRTGGYVEYGFGGFIYERNGDVVLPTTGQATFSGDYSGMRVFNGITGMEYTTGDMTIDIDFDDFNANDAVKGNVTNRVAFDINGATIELGQAADGELELPDLNFVIVEATPSLTANGELSGSVSSYVLDESGVAEEYEIGTYYGVIAGDMTDPSDGAEIVGIIVVESEDPRYGVTAQETGGFILYR